MATWAIPLAQMGIGAIGSLFGGGRKPEETAALQQAAWQMAQQRALQQRATAAGAEATDWLTGNISRQRLMERTSPYTQPLMQSMEGARQASMNVAPRGGAVFDPTQKVYKGWEAGMQMVPQIAQGLMGQAQMLGGWAQGYGQGAQSLMDWSRWRTELEQKKGAGLAQVLNKAIPDLLGAVLKGKKTPTSSTETTTDWGTAWGTP